LPPDVVRKRILVLPAHELSLDRHRSAIGAVIQNSQIVFKTH